MHTTPTLHDWSAIAIGNDQVEVLIDEELSLAGVKIKVLGKNRNFISETIPVSRDTVICAPTGDPAFVELHTPTGVSVHYVTGSGNSYYFN